MFKKISIIMLLISPFILNATSIRNPYSTQNTLTQKSFMIEALYGFGYMNHPQNGYMHEGEIHATFLTTDFSHEILGRASFSQKSKVKINGNDISSSYMSYEVEYRFGMRLDNDMNSLGMLFGTIYLGVGYQNVTRKEPSRINTQYIYIPLGFWGEDVLSQNLSLRYGLNTKFMFLDNSRGNKFKIKVGYGGKVYLGVGYHIGGIMDIFAQAYFSYNAPIRNLRQYGLEVGLKF